MVWTASFTLMSTVLQVGMVCSEHQSRFTQPLFDEEKETSISSQDPDHKPEKTPPPTPDKTNDPPENSDPVERIPKKSHPDPEPKNARKVAAIWVHDKVVATRVHEKLSQPGFMRKLLQPGFVRKLSQPGFMRKLSQPGLMTKLSQPGFMRSCRNQGS